MKLSESYFYTLREDVKDEESVSGNLLVKSGMFKKVGNGISGSKSARSYSVLCNII